MCPTQLAAASSQQEVAAAAPRAGLSSLIVSLSISLISPHRISLISPQVKGENEKINVKRLPKKPAPPRFGRKLTARQRELATHICVGETLSMLGLLNSLCSDLDLCTETSRWIIALSQITRILWPQDVAVSTCVSEPFTGPFVPSVFAFNALHSAQLPAVMPCGYHQLSCTVLESNSRGNVSIAIP